MARHLYRLGRGAYRRKGWVLLAWVLLLALSVTAAATLKGPTSDRFTLPGLESTDAFALIKERIPNAAPDGAQATVVFRAPAGSTVTTPANRAAIAASLATLTSPNIVSVTDPFVTGSVSKDGTIAFATANYAKQSFELTDADRDNLNAAAGPGQKAGMQVAIGGNALQEIPSNGAAELIGVAVAAVILLVTFGTLLAAGMPLLTAVFGLGVGMSLIVAATGLINLGSSAPILASMLGLAVGIDYALFIVSRYRHEVRLGLPRDEAAGIAVGTAGSAVVFAGLTVVIALVGLSVVNIRFLTEMGIAAAVTVAFAVLIALTLLPAMLGLLGRFIDKVRIPFLRDVDPEDDTARATFGRRWATLVTRHRVPTILIVLGLSALLASPISSLRLALPDDGSKPAGSGPRVAYDLITEGFGAGANGPLLLVVDTTNARDPQGAVDAVMGAAMGVKKDVAAVVPPVMPPPPPDAPPAARERHEAAVAAYTQQLTKANLATVTVVPQSGPSDADTEDLVNTLRTTMNEVERTTGAHVYVTGQTALGVDISAKLASVFPIYLGIVVGLAFLLLMLVFRSLLVPLKAVLGFLLSVGISLGITVAVFQWGWLAGLIGVDTPGPIMALLPILLIGIMFGLAMDYEVFLVSRMREEYIHGTTAEESVVTGFQHGARVVTAAALIMVGVFAAFVITGQDAVIKTIGFGLAVGIVADAFLVRMTLVPAVMSLMGDRSWALPRWLDRVLPNLDIEGESLRDVRRGDGTTAAAPPAVPEA